TNIYTSNSAYAQNTIAAGATGSNEDATNFGLTVPATAVVEGVTFTVQRMASASAARCRRSPRPATRQAARS
ncbi:MAG: hypothetical protein ACXVZ3_02680, partial [Gaiellaceae bacterium]